MKNESMKSKWVGRALLLLLTFPLMGVAGQVKAERSPVALTQWLGQKNYAIRFVYVAPVSVTFGPNMPTTFRQAEVLGPRAGAWTPGFPLGLQIEFVIEMEER